LVECGKPSDYGILFFMSKKQPFEELKNVKFGRLTIVEEVFGAVTQFSILHNFIPMTIPENSDTDASFYFIKP